MLEGPRRAALDMLLDLSSVVLMTEVCIKGRWWWWVNTSVGGMLRGLRNMVL